MTVAESIEDGSHQLRFVMRVLIVLVLTMPAISAARDCDSQNHMGAGILPFAHDTGGDILVLLGFQSGRGWSSFGGGPKQVESVQSPKPKCESRKETALREGVEELRFLISRSSLAKLLQRARSFPAEPKRTDFMTFVVPINHIDLEPYYTTTVLTGSGYTETSEVGWIPLLDLIKFAKGTESSIKTPNGEDLWDEFWPGLASQLKAQSGEELFGIHQSSSSDE